jgi:hypothetical protein
MLTFGAWEEALMVEMEERGGRDRKLEAPVDRAPFDTPHPEPRCELGRKAQGRQGRRSTKHETSPNDRISQVPDKRRLSSQKDSPRGRRYRS